MSRAEPSKTEIEILQSLWERKVSTVRDVHSDILKHRAVGYTTTLKQIQRMVEKGLVRKVSSTGRSHTYRAVPKPARTKKELVARLIDSAFDGSSNALIAQAIGYSKPSKAEIDEIRTLLDSLDDETQ